mgnify:CR=1 FL=1
MAIFSAIASAILGATLAATTAFTIGATAITWGAILATTLQALTIFGGVALSLACSKKGAGDYGATSPTYAQAQKQTQTNSDLPIPLVYGTVKLAGNRIYQNESSENKIKRIVAFSDGEITDFTEIKLNDIDYTDSSKVPNCTVEKFYGTATQGLPSMVSDKNVGSLKNLAYLAITCGKNSDIGVNYNLTTIVKGRKIRVYTTLTHYTVEYSENPAWVMFDFLTAYNGLGLCLNNDGTLNDSSVAELFDLTSFIESAAYCDEIIDVVDGVGIKRFTFNMVFDSQTSARDLIDEIYRNCRGGLFTKDGKLQFKIDKAEEVSKVFTKDDIVKGSETFQTIPNEEHYDILKLVYISPEHEWQKVEAFAEIPEYRDGVPIEHSVNCYSITNFQQASRLAWYYVNSKILCPYFGSFKTDYRAYDLEVGDVIQFDSLLMGLTGYKVKVTSVVNDGAGTFTVNWRNYDEKLYNDTLGSKTPTALVVNISEQYELPEDVQNFNVVQSGDLYVMTWSLNNDSDTYEIRYGDTDATWETAETIQKGTLINTFSYKIKQTGIKKFFIKAHNEYNYSENATMDVLSVDSVPELNVLVSYDIIKSASGTHNQTTIYNNKLKLAVNNVLWHNLTDKWGTNNQYYKNGSFWGAEVYTSGIYISQVYDLGGVLMNSINYTNAWDSEDEEANVTYQWRYSQDNITWSSWQDLTIGTFTFRYSQYKVIINSPNKKQVVCTDLTVIIDVPDRFETKDVTVTDAQAGVRVNYDGYHIIPSIVATVNDNITAYAVVYSKSISSAVIKIYDNSGTLTTGNISLYIKGY